MMKVNLSLILLFILSACSSISPYEVNEGAAANEMTVSYHYSGSVPEPIDYQKANGLAEHYCTGKGFGTYTLEGEPKQVCDRYTGYYACLYKRVEQPYRCE